MFRRLAQTLLSTAIRSADAEISQSFALGYTSTPPSALNKLRSWWSLIGIQQPCASQLTITRDKYTYAFKKAATMPGLIFWKPRTPGLRHKISIDYKALGVYTGPPVPSLSFRKHNSGGRNRHGHITVRGRGGGIEKIVRKVDFVQGSGAVQGQGTVVQGQAASKALAAVAGGVVERIEHDPNRTGFIALVRYESGSGDLKYTYHLAPHGLREGEVIQAGPDAPIQPGNRLQLKDIPLGVRIHNIEMRPGGGGRVARAAGVGASIQYKEDDYAVVTMPSGEVRRLLLGCAATIGTVSNPLNKLTIMGKAGVNRVRGRRPKVRGIAMNPVDHPHGGRTNGGRPSCTPWGVYCKGQRTRLRNKWSNRYIIMRKGGAPIEKFVQAKKWRVRVERERREKSGAPPPHSNPGPPQSMRGPRPPAWGVVAHA